MKCPKCKSEGHEKLYGAEGWCQKCREEYYSKPSNDFNAGLERAAQIAIERGKWWLEHFGQNEMRDGFIEASKEIAKKILEEMNGRINES